MQRKSSGAKILLLSAILLTAIAQPIMAQSQNITGAVVDASGGMIPQATIKIVDLAKGDTARQTTTDQSGRFLAIDIQPGSYRIDRKSTRLNSSHLGISYAVF